MNCPKCAGPMSRVNLEGYEVDRCTRCGGLWFDLLEHEHLARADAAAIESLDAGDTETGAAMNDRRDIICPRDGATLIKMGVLGQPQLAIERCNTCGGSFFDAGEFRDFTHTSPGEWLRKLMPGRR